VKSIVIREICVAQAQRSVRTVESYPYKGLIQYL